MKAIINGVIRDLTPEEETKIKESCEKENSQITDTNRISALESAIADLAVMMVGGANNG